MTVAIRPANEHDFSSIADLVNHYIRHTAIHFGYDAQSPEDLRSQWAESRHRFPWLIAEVRGQFAGYAKASVWRERAAYQWTPECGVYVAQPFHRRGVGRALYTELFATLRRQGFESVIAGITLPNEPSVRMHESLGFIPAGVIRRAGWKLGRWWDVGFWQLPLGQGAPAGTLTPPATV